jgi:hypothetical protein
VTAKATTATTQTASVILVSPAPIISSFSVKGRIDGSGGTSYIPGDGWMDGDVIGLWLDTVFSWSATGADSYQLLDPWGAVMYSGTGTAASMNGSYMPYANYIRMGSTATFTLKAIKGAQVSTRTVTAAMWYRTCPSCGN